MNYQQILQIPKTELHVHVEALIRLQTLKELVRAYRLPQFQLEQFQRKLLEGYHGIEDFFQSWHFLNQILRKPEDFARVTYEYLETSAKQNTRYIEFNLNVLRQEEKGIDVSEIIRAMAVAQNQAARRYNIFGRTILSFSRDFSIADGKRIVDLAVAHQKDNVVGIDIAGNEKKKPNNMFTEIFQYAAEKQVPRAAHAGEGAGQNSLRDAITQLGVSRVGHAADAAHDTVAFSQLLTHRIGVELCITSNQILGVSNHTTASHIGKKLLEQGALVTFNTDDPTLFGMSLQDEYYKISQSWNLRKSHLLQVYRNGIKIAFAEEEIKRQLLLELENTTQQITKRHFAAQELYLAH